MPGIYEHLGSLHLDFPSNLAYLSEIFYESNIYSAQHIETHFIDTMEKVYTTNHVLREVNNVASLKDKGKSFFQTVWNQCTIGNFSRLFILVPKIDTPLSVTLVNDKLLMPETILKSYNMIEEKNVDYSSTSKMFKNTQPNNSTTVDPSIKDHPKDMTEFKSYFNNKKEQIKENKDIIEENLIYNMMDFNITCKDKSTMESHSTSNVHEIKDSNNVNNKSCSTEIDLQQLTDTDKNTLNMNKNPTSSSNVDVNEDTKSFLMVSHSDVPQLVRSVRRKPPMSIGLSGMCRNVWNSLTTQFYCRTNSMESEKSIKCPSYLLKRHHQRKVNAIAMGRGRNRKRCQLRRSGVSQTRHRKKCSKQDFAMIIEMDYELYQNEKMQYRIQNLLNDDSDNDLDDMDGYDVPDGTFLVKQTSPAILDSCNITSMKQKPQTSENQETVKHPRVRYVIDSLTNSIKDYNKKTCDVEENPSRQSRLLSVSSIDSEDSYIVFEGSDDKSPKQETAEYSTGLHYTLDSSMEINEDCNSEIFDMHDNSTFRSRLLSECSVNSEDSFIVFKDIEDESPKKQEAMKHPTRVRYVADHLTKIIRNYHKDYKSEMQKDMLRPRLLSESSSVDSEDSFILFQGSDDESPKQEITDDLNEIHDVSDSSTSMIIDNGHCKDCNNKRYGKDSFQFSEGSEDSFCVVFNTELEENCATDNFDYIKTSTSIPMQNNSIKSKLIENDDSEESITQTKKVSFAPAPIVHFMITWNYAYRAARKGQWEEMARDNERFKGRINSIAAVLNPILTSKHRSKVWQERFALQE